MKSLFRLLPGSIVLLACVSSAHAIPTFGAYAIGSDLDPNSGFLSDGGRGSSSASVSFDTFAAEAIFDPQATYLPVLRAQANGVGAIYDDDRTQASPAAYEVFASSVTQVINLHISFDSTVTNSSTGTSGALLDVYVYGGPNFLLSDTFCSGGERTPDGIYLCGDRIATSARNPNLDWSNLFNGNGTNELTDTLTFTANAGEPFGIYAELKTGAFQGTVDAFNTVKLEYVASNIGAINPVNVPGGPPSVAPLPGTVWLLGMGILGVLASGQKNRQRK